MSTYPRPQKHFNIYRKQSQVWFWGPMNVPISVYPKTDIYIYIYIIFFLSTHKSYQPIHTIRVFVDPLRVMFSVADITGKFESLAKSFQLDSWSSNLKLIDKGTTRENFEID